MGSGGQTTNGSHTLVEFRTSGALWPCTLPPDDLKRNLTIAQIDKDQSLWHIGLVGDTYTITVTGDATAGRFSVIDMHIPPGGRPSSTPA
jgi:hypothetical protein